MPSDILFEHHDWILLPETPDNCECAWTNQKGVLIVLEHLLGPDKGLRKALADVNAARERYRHGFAVQGNGLIECDLFDLDTVRAVRAIAKLIVQPTQAVYIGTIALPLPKESYVFNMFAKEIGISGVRETAVLMKTDLDLKAQGYEMELPKKGESQPRGEHASMTWKHPQTGVVVRWAEDPYDPSYDGPCLRNMADAPECDVKFPNHPLTQVRMALRCLTEGVRLSDQLKRGLGSKQSQPSKNK